MVSCSLFGRYGNQLFQVAATIAYSLRHNMYYSIPKYGLNFGRKTTYKFPNQTDLRSHPTYNQPTHGYTEIPFMTDVNLYGHFQSEKYFEDYRNEVRLALGFPKARLDLCAIHVRRGDYVNQQSRFPVLPIEYYNKSIVEMLKREVTEFVIFSDDIAWCKDNFIGYGYKFEETEDAQLCLKYMAAYKYMIIANSSYSLFASLINDKECVISPKHTDWFGKDINLETKDLIPYRFIQI
jgi:hypothetical protein